LAEGMWDQGLQDGAAVASGLWLLSAKASGGQV